MKIVIDEYYLNAYSENLVVKDDKSFVEARKQILEYKFGKRKNDTIIVRSYPYSEWFSDVETESQISVERLLPSHKLRERFKEVEPDKDLDEKSIVLLDLINQTIEPTEVSIVNKYIGPFLFDRTDLKDQLYQISGYAADPPKLFIASDYLNIKWAKYLDKIECENSIIRKVISKIKEGDPDFCRVINQLIYVSNSQYLLREWIHDNRIFLETCLQGSIQDLEKFLSESRLRVSVNEHYEARIEGFFKTLYAEDLNLFFKESGDYRASLKAFLALAKTITNEEKEIILNKYGRNIDFDLEDKIKSLIRPELTSPPNINDLTLLKQIEEWQNWAAKTFIPFKFYLDEFQNDKDEALVEKYANVYSDWLFNSYSAIVQSGIKTNYNNVGIISEALRDSKVIWLIIDGFPLAFMETLCSILKSSGINKIEESYHFAAIPTITSIGIPTQLCGRVPQSDAFTENREDGLKLAFGSKKVIFKNNIKAFSEALESDFDVCCLHWQEIDEFMHKEDNHVEGRRIDEIKRLLNIRIIQIVNVIKSNADRKIKLIISTDHGTTKCLNKGEAIKNSSLMEACRDNPKERCVELSGTLAGANIDDNDFYYLKSEQTLNKRNWAVARGYRYFGRFDYGYRHGGLTPEETIVPFLNCEIAQHEIIPIKVGYGGLADLQLGYTESFRLIVKNDNDALVEIDKIAILEDKNFSVDLQNQVQPSSSRVFDGKIKLSKATVIKEGKASLNVVIKYSVFGQKLTASFVITVPIRKSINENLDNLFS